VKRRDVIRFEAHAVANRLLGKADMPRVVETRKLWDEANEATVDLDVVADEADDPALPPDAEDAQLPEEPPC
jgi:hypothetical protein